MQTNQLIAAVLFPGWGRAAERCETCDGGIRVLDEGLLEDVLLDLGEFDSKTKWWMIGDAKFYEGVGLPTHLCMSAWERRVGQPWQSALESAVLDYRAPLPDWSSAEGERMLRERLRELGCIITESSHGFRICNEDLTFNERRETLVAAAEAYCKGVAAARMENANELKGPNEPTEDT